MLELLRNCSHYSGIATFLETDRASHKKVFKTSTTPAGIKGLRREIAGWKWYQDIISPQKTSPFCRISRQRESYLQLEIEFIEGFTGDYRQGLQKNVEIIEKSIKHYIDIWPYYPERNCPIHGDLSIDNIIINSEGVHFIDWEHFALNGGPWGFDIVYLLFETLWFSFKNIEKLNKEEIDIIRRYLDRLKSSGQIKKEIIDSPLLFLKDFLLEHPEIWNEEAIKFSNKFPIINFTPKQIAFIESAIHNQKLVPVSEQVTSSSTLYRKYCARVSRFQTNIFAGTTLPEEVDIARNAYQGDIRDFFTGPSNRLFENRFAQEIGTTDSISFATGRMALYAILKALGVGAGDEVIIPAFSCAVVANAIIYTGARPVYGDIETERFSLDPGKMAGVITPRTKAIMAQHTFGIPCFMDEIQTIADTFGIPVVEDCAHALGGSLNGKPLGNLGVAAFFSMDHTKVISSISGGMATSQDRLLLEKIRKIQQESKFISPWFFKRLVRSYIYMYWLSRPQIFFWGRYPLGLLMRAHWLRWFEEYLALTPPSNYPWPARLSDLQAQIGLSQLKHLEENLGHRRQVARQLEEVLGAQKAIFSNPALRPAWLRYPFLVDNRKDLLKALHRYHELGVWFTTVAHCRNDHFEEIYYQKGSCPVAEEVTRKIVSISTHQQMMGIDIISAQLRHLRKTTSETYIYEKGEME